MLSAVESWSRELTDRRLRSGGACGGMGVDLALDCSSDAIDDPGVIGVLLNGLYGLAKGKFGDRASPTERLELEVSSGESYCTGLAPIGLDSGPSFTLLFRWSVVLTGSSVNMCVLFGLGAEGIDLNGGGIIC
jgi:hypothetical protein